MYHEVPSGPSEVGYFAVPRGQFEEQLDEIRGFGLTPCSLEEALDHPPARPYVAFTFDDGHHTHYEEAFPALLARGLTATFFVTSSWVGTPGYVTWDQLREMADAGMSIQSHTETHPFLSELSAAEAEQELMVSKAAIEESLGHACTTIALPGGDHPRGWKAAEYARLGFRHVATSQWGPNRRTRPAPQVGVDFVRRYTVRRRTPAKLLESLARARHPAYSREGLRLVALHTLRGALGATRYARWRSRFLGVVDP